MSELPLTSICLSLAANLRCVGFNLRESAALIIPPAVEIILSLIFICAYSGPARWAQVLLVADGVLFFIWALLDTLSRIIPAVRMSLSIFRIFNILVGAASFTTIFFYWTNLYRLSYHEFIPTFPRKAQPYLEISLPILLLIAVTLNEVSSLLGIYVGPSSQNPVSVHWQFALYSETLWFALSRSSLATYTSIQFLFFILAFSRLSRAFLDQRRIRLTQSDENHHFNGIAWITVGIMVGAIESLAGFSRMSFGIVLARRILRLIARGILMFGLFKGLDVAENFAILTEELRGVSRISQRVSRMIGLDTQRNPFRRISQSYPEPSPVTRYPTSPEKRTGEERVTVHYEKGQAPFLQIRFSSLDFPAQAVLADEIYQRRRSHTGMVPYAGTGHTDDEDDMLAARNAVHETPRAKSALVMSSINHQTALDWMWPPKKVQSRPESGGTISDSLSIVRDLERKFPSLPPRVTGKYRGSILGEKHEEDPFPVVGVSRQSSLRQGANTQSEEGGLAVTLSSSGSIKRKPAPPLLDNIAFVSDRRRRPTSTWGGLTQESAGCSVGSPVTPMTPSSPGMDTTGYSSDTTLARDNSTPGTPRSFRIARDVIRRAGRALSDASIRSAEWLASSKSPSTARTPLTVADIELYRRGTVGPGTPRLMPGYAGASSGENLQVVIPKAIRRSADDAGILPEPSQPRTSVGI